ncbi:PAN domain-containing protein [Citreimonas salinaria]|uniref:Uncharacterized protein n=1 Tax=Citreimonas salinaria TaxID=321339 RepID=A0A1H3M0F3_9RHOB|nr:PAN domain-containing protein [Citreimonas salinaria]SDY70181.1 hypothetical protein SAMN05444340_11538 [Citreimonas salinaria]
MRLFFALLLTLAPLRVAALEFEHEVVDMRPILPKTLEISIAGNFVSGDSDRLQQILTSTLDPDFRDVSVTFDSPGGSLIEGLLMARIFMELPQIVSARVRSGGDEIGVCASACVLAYLGADLRYMPDNTLIGVHRFSHRPGAMTDSEASSQAQLFSSEIVALMQDQGVDMELFRRMSATGPDDIDWVPKPVLESWRAVTGHVFSETMEYRNVNGSLSLHMVHESIYGTNQMFLSCGDKGLIAIAMLDEPELAMLGDAAFVVDGEAYLLPPSEYDLINRDGGRTRIVFNVPPEAVPALPGANTIGARMNTPGGDIFWGFEQNITDSKVRDTALGCDSTMAPQRSQPSPLPAPRMTELPGTDLPGGDMTADGLRDISFAACKQICLDTPSCRAVSFVQSMSWCWPKGSVGPARSKAGVISAVR